MPAWIGVRELRPTATLVGEPVDHAARGFGDLERGE